MMRMGTGMMRAQREIHHLNAKFIVLNGKLRTRLADYGDLAPVNQEILHLSSANHHFPIENHGKNHRLRTYTYLPAANFVTFSQARAIVIRAAMVGAFHAKFISLMQISSVLMQNS